MFNNLKVSVGSCLRVRLLVGVCAAMCGWSLFLSTASRCVVISLSSSPAGTSVGLFIGVDSSPSLLLNRSPRWTLGGLLANRWWRVTDRYNLSAHSLQARSLQINKLLKRKKIKQ